MKKGCNSCGYWCGMWMRANKQGKTLEQFQIPFMSIPLKERDAVAIKFCTPIGVLQSLNGISMVISPVVGTAGP